MSVLVQMPLARIPALGVVEIAAAGEGGEAEEQGAQGEGGEAGEDHAALPARSVASNSGVAPSMPRRSASRASL